MATRPPTLEQASFLRIMAAAGPTGIITRAELRRRGLMEDFLRAYRRSYIVAAGYQIGPRGKAFLDGQTEKGADEAPLPNPVSAGDQAAAVASAPASLPRSRSLTLLSA